ncbi:MAG: asparagine synthase (glutamine-hydrolyzing) [Candidatus Marinimicrobia bacterium]|nr:asparagine synthase (glutamine-hydrolyzing) [Candidatus Neomarinimicrobiota bacterium]
MCGITGYISKKHYNEALICRMTDTLSHRGPDSSGFSFHNINNSQLALGHRRLSILDLSENANQPMSYKHFTIIFNGEIYNHLELRNILEKAGYSFKTTSDTETLLKGFEFWQTELFEKLNGMFALAIIDEQNGELILCRDRMGIKPLYYYHDHKNFVFGSELKPIMVYPEFSKTIDLDSLFSFLYHNYITAPGSIFQNTFKLEAGKYLKYKNGEITIKTYWSLKDKFLSSTIIPKSEKDYLIELDKLLSSSVKYRMLSDVPIGSFLSGGYDSSLVSAIMQKHSSQPINTFCIGFNDKNYNESDYAKQISKYLKTHHHELFLNETQLMDLVMDIPHYYDEPLSDSSQLPTLLLSKFTRKKVTVVLSGDGGDELFCGYNAYQRDMENLKLLKYGKVFRRFKNLPPFLNVVQKINPRFLKFFYLTDPNSIINAYYQLFFHQYQSLIINFHPQLNKQYFHTLDWSDNLQEKHMLSDMLNYLPEDILTKVDRASMSVSLEARTPILDHRLVEFSFSLPHHLKYNNGEKKYLLRQLAYQYIPKKLLDRPKQGFEPPIRHWLNNNFYWMIDKYLQKEFINRQALFNYDEIHKIKSGFQKETNLNFFKQLIWNLVVFQLWYERYLK